MNNNEIAAVLKDIASLLQKKNEDWFKIRAYLRVAKTIESLEVPVSQMAAEGRLRDIPGVGDAIEKKMVELINTGHLVYYEKLKAGSVDDKSE